MLQALILSIVFAALALIPLLKSNSDAANREVAGHATVLATYGSFRVSVQPTSYVFESGKPVRVKVTAQDYDNKPVQTAVHLKAVLKHWDSGARQWSESQVQTADSSTGPDGTALVDLSVSGNGSFEVTASAQTPENRTVRDAPGYGSGTDPASSMRRTLRLRSWPTRKATR